MLHVHLYVNVCYMAARLLLYVMHLQCAITLVRVAFPPTNVARTPVRKCLLYGGTTVAMRNVPPQCAICDIFPSTFSRFPFFPGGGRII